MSVHKHQLAQNQDESSDHLKMQIVIHQLQLLNSSHEAHEHPGGQDVDVDMSNVMLNSMTSQWFSVFSLSIQNALHFSVALCSTEWVQI